MISRFVSKPEPDLVNGPIVLLFKNYANREDFNRRVRGERRVFLHFLSAGFAFSAVGFGCGGKPRYGISEVNPAFTVVHAEKAEILQDLLRANSAVSAVRTV